MACPAWAGHKKKSETPDLADRVNLTAGTIERLTCPPGKHPDHIKRFYVP
jgi:hypothetical protein